jgi:hypothetical protein
MTDSHVSTWDIFEEKLPAIEVTKGRFIVSNNNFVGTGNQSTNYFLFLLIVSSECNGNKCQKQRTGRCCDWKLVEWTSVDN